MGNILPIQIMQNIQKPIVIQNGLPTVISVPIPIFSPVTINLKTLPQTNINSVFGKNNEELDLSAQNIEGHFGFSQKNLTPDKIFRKIQRSAKVPYPEAIQNNIYEKGFLGIYNKILSGIDYEKFKENEFEIYKDFITNPDILKACYPPDLIINLINSKNIFGLKLLAKGFSGFYLQKFTDEGLFTPDIIEAFNKADLDIPNETMEKLLSLGKQEIEEIFTYFNCTTLNEYLPKNSKNADVVSLKAKKDLLKDAFKTMTPHKIIVSKLITSDNGNFEAKRKRINSLTTFYLTQYGNNIIDIEEKEENFLAINPLEYGLPELFDIDGNMIILEAGDYSSFDKYRLEENGFPAIKKIIADLKNNQKFYEILENGNIKLNNGNRIRKTNKGMVLYRLARSEKSKQKTEIILEKVDLDKDNFPTVTRYKNGIPQKDKISYRYTQPDGKEVKIIDLKTKDGFSYTKRITATPDKSYIANKVLLKDKEGKEILNFTSRLEQNDDGNKVTRINGTELHEYTSKIEDEQIILTHNEKTYIVPLNEIIHLNRERSFSYPPLYIAYCMLTGEEPKVCSPPSEREFILNLAQKTVDNFRKFLRKINADDLLIIAKNGQKIDLKQFGYDSDGEPLENNNYGFYSDEIFYFNPNEYSSITNTHEITHGSEKILNISYREKINKLYEKELKNISAEGKYYLDYFLPCSSSPAEGLGELIAETGAIMNAMDMKHSSSTKSIQVRMLKLMQEFPQTTAAIIKILLEDKENL